MSLQLNSINGSVTLVPEDGAGNVNVTVPRSGLGGIGNGQTWQDMTASRAAGITYTNTTGRSISVIMTSVNNLGSYTYLHLIIDGVTVSSSNNTTPQAMNANAGYVTAIIPDGSTYSCVLDFGILYSWMELR